MSDFSSINWESIATETNRDDTLHRLVTLVQEGFDYATTEDHINLSPYWRLRDELIVADNVILYRNRAIVPTSLRKSVLENLHSGHQGISAMKARAQILVYWPGMTEDIKAIRDNCAWCNKNAPSQAATPPVQSTFLPLLMSLCSPIILNSKVTTTSFQVIDSLDGWTSFEHHIVHHLQERLV